MFVVGKEYNRKEEIHGVYGGQAQGGISTPAGHDLILLFTGDAGHEFGYEDKFRPDGVFLYTGEGQSGDMQWVRGNLAIRNHLEAKKKLHLFEYVRKGRVRYLGKSLYVGHHIEQRPDINGATRSAIVFHLSLCVQGSGEVMQLAPGYGASASPRLSLPLGELRKLAIESVADEAHEKEIKNNLRVRSEAVRLYALKRASGKCEGCGNAAPFIGRDRSPYLEVHHVFRLGDGGPDHPAFVVALCPNCHRKVHFGSEGDLLNQALIGFLKNIEST